ncbi:farnesol dehydrogenase [Tribolium castaneum]|uniref:Dehydrogenase/reductase SDR family protein 7-like n=1 Tax=Tribolium castaneum TaxID=7070 RepID=D2A5V8_TRICA|nr:PREDICTED: farnesol dehydrogenase isoform X1 [Tribolium castaneum]XP_015836390.1 PREDICTED: farnesol dehydrogenase isoform X2 [Tribolium castaneum]EFA05017.1 Dehydrogenase/reductase SDR family protein 7-like [Tribolium castaneum]|eukprot:XP_015836389.1 PREDICTED: farnesol dehydrogenase isoform X1 [Tribolium castaneum]
MDRWEGKIAIVTGASSGIGAAIAKLLVQKGLKVIGLARRVERVEELAADLADQPGELFAVACDLTKEESILEAFKWVIESVGPVHILINNAGLTKATSLSDGDSDLWRQVLEVNIMALCICTREAVKIMKEYDIDGHIIHLNSIAGHQVQNIPDFNVYPASKFAVTALTETLRQELVRDKTRIKVTSISPGVVRTEFQEGMGGDDMKEMLAQIPALKPENIAQAVVYVLGTEPNVQVSELTIRPVGDPF